MSADVAESQSAMRRRDPFPLADALESVTRDLQPQTALAEIQRVWPEAVGETIAKWATPAAEKDGVLTVHCKDSVTAHHLNAMQDEVLEMLSARLGRAAPKELKFRAGTVR